MIYQHINIEEDYTVSPLAHLVVYLGGGGHTITLPGATAIGREIKIANASAAQLTVICQGADTLGGVRSTSMNCRTGLTVVCPSIGNWIYF